MNAKVKPFLFVKSPDSLEPFALSVRRHDVMLGKEKRTCANLPKSLYPRTGGKLRRSILEYSVKATCVCVCVFRLMPSKKKSETALSPVRVLRRSI